MTSPANDPRCLQILDKLCLVFAAISQATGYFNDVKGAGIEPLSFTENDTYPQIVIEEASSRIGDTNSTQYLDDLLLNVYGLVPIGVTNANRLALLLREDITVAAMRLVAGQFIGSDGKQLVRQIGIGSDRSITQSGRNTDFIEVAVVIAVTYSQFLPPISGNN